MRVAVTDVGTRTGLGGGGNGEAVDIGGMGSVGSDAKVDMRDKGIKRVGSVRQGAVQSQGKLDRRIIAEQGQALSRRHQGVLRARPQAGPEPGR